MNEALRVSVPLKWAGPFSLHTEDQRRRFQPPEYGGVYLWTIPLPGGLGVAYVGQAANIRQRQYEHIQGTLGGAYQLYGREYFEEGAERKVEYRPQPEELNRRFMDEFRELSKLAYDNLAGYRMFWAEVEGDKERREHVESALIEAVRRLERVIQNDRVSRRADPARPLRIQSTFGVAGPVGLPETIDWPE